MGRFVQVGDRGKRETSRGSWVRFVASPERPEQRVARYSLTLAP